jgi:hypothetical protein
MRIWRGLVLVVVMLWLPMQGFAAVAMPFCMHALGDSGGVQMNGAHHHQHHNHHGPSPGDTHHDQSTPTGLLCNECGACHLACAPVAPCVTVSLVAPGGHAFGFLPPASPSLFIPEQLERPPLSAIV